MDQETNMDMMQLYIYVPVFLGLETDFERVLKEMYIINMKCINEIIAGLGR